MSAFQCSADHLAAIAGTYVSRLIDAGEVAIPTAATFHLLARENVNSLNYRYPASNGYEAVEPVPYDQRNSDLLFKYVAKPVSDPAAYTKLLDCYRYQACEHPGWEQSDACQLIEAARALTSGSFTRAEYDDAPWGI